MNIKPEIKRPLFLVILLISFRSYAVDKDLPILEQAKTAYTIAEQVYFVDHFYAFDNVLVGYKSVEDMKLLTRSDKSVSLMKSERFITHDPALDSLKTQDLVIFKTGKLRGTGILVDDFIKPQPMQIRMWLPALRKIRRFSEPELDDIWGGSHLTYGDLYLRRPEHEKHQLSDINHRVACLTDASSFNHWAADLLKQEVTDWCELLPRPLILIKSIPKAPSPWYDYRLRLIDAETFAEYQVEYFKNDELVKRIQKNWHSVGLEDKRAQLWTFWSVKVFKDGKTIGESLAWIDESSYAWNQDVSNKLWSEKSLRKIRR